MKLKRKSITGLAWVLLFILLNVSSVLFISAWWSNPNFAFWKKLSTTAITILFTNGGFGIFFFNLNSYLEHEERYK